MSIKMIVSDLDGTLLAPDHLHISKRNLDTLRRASQKGIMIGLGTGRNFALIEDLLPDLPFLNFAILSNGAVAYDPSTRENIIYRGMPHDIWSPLYEFLFDHHCVTEIYFEGKSYLEESLLSNYENPDVNGQFLDRLKKRITPVDNVKSFIKERSIEKINVLHTPQENIEAVQAFLENHEDIFITSSIPGNMELSAKGINKGTTLELLCKTYGINRNEVMTFGDSGNDIEMLEWADYSFAMENAWDEVKEAAHYMTASNADDGVAEAIDRYVFAKDLL